MARGAAAISLGFTVLTNADRLAKFFGIVNIPKDAKETLVAFASIPTPLAWGIFLIGIAALGFLLYDRKSAFPTLRRRGAFLEPIQVIVLGLVIACGGAVWLAYRTQGATEKPPLVQNGFDPLGNSINALLLKRGYPLSRAGDGSIHISSDALPFNAPYISYWNVDTVGPWPTVPDGFTEYQVRRFPAKLPKFTTQYDKEKFREALDKLSYVISRLGGRIIAQTRDIGGRTPLVVKGGENSVSRIKQIDEIKALMGEFYASLWDGNNAIIDEYPSYKEELRGVLPYSSPREAWGLLGDALGKLGAALVLVQDAERHSDDNALFSDAVNNLSEYQRTLANASGIAGGWVIDCEKRIELLRQSL